MNNDAIEEISKNKIRVSAIGIALFNSRWPGSKLRERSYWFEFDEDQNLIDSDVPEQDDGDEATALSEDCKSYLFYDLNPEWLP